MKTNRPQPAPTLEAVLTQLQTEAGPTPIAIERLVQTLKTDCGSEARIEVIPSGTTHAGTQRKFLILLVCKKQKLNSLCTVDALEVLDVMSKRSGAFVSTRIIVKVENSVAHPQPLVS